MRNRPGMRICCKLFVILLVYLPAVSVSQLPDKASADAAATVKSFYTFHFKNKFDYSRQGLRQRQRWLDATLYQLLLAELKRSDASTKKNEVPELNGDPFTNSQEYPNSFRIGDTRQEYGKAFVEVVLLWQDKGEIVAEKNIGVELSKSKTVWKISNIIDKADSDGDLLHLLKRGK